jgi:hypothetical protein
MWCQFPPNLSCLQNNPPKNNVEQFPPNLSCLQNNPPENNVEPVPAKWTAGYLRFGGNWHYIIFRWIVLGLIVLDLDFFSALVLGTN